MQPGGSSEGPEEQPRNYPPPSYPPPGYEQPGYPQQGGYQYPAQQYPGQYAPSGYYAQMAPRPGSIPLRPLGVGEILDGAIRTIQRNPKVTLGFSAAVASVQAIFYAVYELISQRAIGTFSSTNTSSGINSGTSTVNGTVAAPSAGDVGTVLIGLVATLAVSAVVSAVLSGALTLVVTDDVLGRKIQMRVVWERLRPRLLGLIGLSLIVGVLPYIGLIFFVAPGVWLWGIWALAVPAYMVERVGVMSAVGRSRALVKGMFWRVWGTRALGVLIAGFVGGLIAMAVSAVAIAASGISTDNGTIHGGSIVIYVIVSGLGTILSTAISAPLRAGIDSLLYVDQRMRKEGLDIVLQQAAATAQP